MPSSNWIAHQGLVRASSGLQNRERAADHLPVPQFLDGDQVELLQSVTDQPEFRVVTTSGGEDPDVPGGHGDLVAGQRQSPDEG